uniref:Tpd52 like 2b n=1 Tax=Sinocyclocheilus grahami TaxID=75366 RepID=A0A672PT03_SINGR
MDNINLNSPHKGLGSDSLSDMPEEKGAAAVSPGTLPPGLTEEEAEELRLELTKVNTYSHCMTRGLRMCSSSPICLQIRAVILTLLIQSDSYLSASATLDDISSSEVYKKTQETLSQAGQKTSAALSTVGTAISRKLGDMRHLSIKSKSSGKANGESAHSPNESNPVQDNAPF